MGKEVTQRTKSEAEKDEEVRSFVCHGTYRKGCQALETEPPPAFCVDIEEKMDALHPDPNADEETVSNGMRSSACLHLKRWTATLAHWSQLTCSSQENGRI